MAEAYAWKNKRIAPSEERDLFVSMLPKKGKILDFGRGHGRDSIFFSDLGFEVTAIDPSEGLVNEARKDKPSVDFKIGSVADLNFPDKFFDGVWCNAVLHHLPSDEFDQALARIKKLLKDDGIFYLLNRTKDQDQAVFTKEGPEGASRYFYYMTPDEIKKRSTGAGYEIIKEIIFNKQKRHGKEYEDIDVQCLYLRKKMKKSMQEIEDSYINRGLTGEKLRQALESDTEYQALLADKKSRITNEFGISDEDKNRYVLATQQDFEILSRCQELESQRISDSDREMVELIKSQLLDEWRQPIFEKLSEIEKNYKKSRR